MKFIHIADIHFDAAFTNLNSAENQGEIRRLEQREALKKVIEYIKQEQIPYLFISGDLYEQEYVSISTIEYINNLFKQIPQTKIYISPGNHDPYIKNSYYNTYQWNTNVYIFKQGIEQIENEEIDIYGYAFNDFYVEDSEIEKIQIKNKEKINILITHASLDASTTLEKQYNPITRKNLEKLGFDYIALGHIHKPNYKSEQKIIYPGSLISLGFDEPGEHGMIYGEIGNKNIKIKFIKIDEKEYIEKTIDISEMNYEEELIEKINNINEKNKIYKIILNGKRNFKINKNKILKTITNKNVLKIKDKTKISYDLEKIKQENNIKGIFVKKMLSKQKNNEYTQEEIEKAIELGIENLT